MHELSVINNILGIVKEHSANHGGNKVTKKVTDVRIVRPTDTQWLQSSSEDLITIVTCYPFDYVAPAPK